ncbi:MAG: ABC transporter substrate-binding protein [Acidimicrobiia bacterium]|nr:ABC transporter substrate-binding protein [Acidimicrobiia bacterium]
MNTTTSRWRWLALLAVMAMIVAACSDTGGEEPSDDTGATTTTAAPDDTDTTEPMDDGSSEGFPYTIAIFSDPTTDNPWAALDTENDVWTNYVNPDGAALYTYQGPTYTLVPAMAQDDSPPELVADGDNWSVTVTLRDDVRWSDGEVVDANDVVFTFNTVAKYDGLGGNFPALWPLAREDDPSTEDNEGSNGVVSVEAIDDLTVKITFNFEAGLAVWPFQVGVAPVFPEHFWGPIVDANDTFEGLYAESGLGYPNFGAFESTEWEPGAFWRNSPVDDYWDKGSQYTVYENGAVEYTGASGLTEVWGGEPSGEVVSSYVEGPFATDVTFSLYSDQNAAVLALTDGSVDFLLNPLGLQRGLQQLVLSEPELNVIVNEQNGYRYLAFNTRKFPMNDKAFRQAIACRIDKEFMANTVLGGAAIAANSQVPPGNSFWANPDLAGTCDGQSEQERFESAKQILIDAGYTWTTEPVWDEANRDVLPQGAGLAGPDGTPVPAMELLAPGPGYDPLRATYSLFIEQWATDLGIPVTANPTGFSVIVDQVFAGGDAALEWDMYILGWGLTPFPDHVFTFFDSRQDSANGGFNTPGYNNPEFDALNDAFGQAKTLEEARDLIFQGDAIINEDMPYVVLFTTPIIEAYRNTVNFPFTTVLDGLQNFGGLPGAVTSS